jgi:hypothetical protein
MTNWHSRVCPCNACSTRRETELRAQLERLTDRIATQAEIIAAWSDLIDSMESEIATLRALAAGRTEYLRGFDDGVYSAKKEYGISDSALAGDAPKETT